jgi:broad specificity phosphatase PhoE
MSRVVRGWTDTPLNATGRQQALQLKSKLAGIPIDAAYSSTLSRSRETAQLAYGTDRLTSLPALRERNFGTYQGKVTTDPQVAPEYDRRRWLPDDSLDGGESLNVLEQRVRTAIETVRRQHPSGSVLVVGHGHTNQIILKQVFNLSIEQTRRITQANDEVYLVELQQGSEPRLCKLIVAKNLTDL